MAELHGLFVICGSGQSCWVILELTSWMCHVNWQTNHVTQAQTSGLFLTHVPSDMIEL